MSYGHQEINIKVFLFLLVVISLTIMMIWWFIDSVLGMVLNDV